MSAPTPTEVQARADALAATFNRAMQAAHDHPFDVEKVERLHRVRDLFNRITAGGVGPGTGFSSIENLEPVRKQLDAIEATCRRAGLFEAYANMSRAERRRLQRKWGA